VADLVPVRYFSVFGLYRSFQIVAQESLSALPIALPILALFGDVCRLWTVLSDALLLRYDLYLNESVRTFTVHFVTET
jgi:hypothetical protein